jgi:hypothetical protein
MCTGRRRRPCTEEPSTRRNPSGSSIPSSGGASSTDRLCSTSSTSKSTSASECSAGMSVVRMWRWASARTCHICPGRARKGWDKALRALDSGHPAWPCWSRRGLCDVRTVVVVTAPGDTSVEVVLPEGRSCGQLCCAVGLEECPPERTCCSRGRQCRWRSKRDPALARGCSARASGFGSPRRRVTKSAVTYGQPVRIRAAKHDRMCTHAERGCLRQGFSQVRPGAPLQH